MSEPLVPDPGRPLDQISTHWTLISQPNEFALRYLHTIQAYLTALLRNPQDAEEVLQEFMLGVLQRGFERASPDRGRFRHYLKVAVRNCALNWLRRRRVGVDVALLQDTLVDDQPSPEQHWRAGWRRCLLDKVWRELDRHERRSPGNHAFTVLRVVMDHPDENSPAQAARAAARLGKELKPEAFRKQVSRARRLFAGLLLEEVYQTLDQRDPVVAEEELLELDLLGLVRDYLPPDWRNSAPGKG